MRTNIDIDDTLMRQAMKAGPYRTKKEAVEAALKLLARQVAYREILKWEGKLKWEGDESIDWTKPADDPEPAKVKSSVGEANGKTLAARKRSGVAQTAAKVKPATTRRAGR